MRQGPWEQAPMHLGLSWVAVITCLAERPVGCNCLFLQSIALAKEQA